MNSPKICARFQFRKFFALILLYIKLDFTSSFQPPAPRAHLAAKHFRKIWKANYSTTKTKQGLAVKNINEAHKYLTIILKANL